MTEEFRFYIDTDPATAGDRNILARREKGGAGLCYFGSTLKEVEAKVTDRLAREAAWATPAGPAAVKPRPGSKARKAGVEMEAVDG